MRITPKGPSGSIGTLRTPMGKEMNGLIKKGSLRPPVCPDTLRKDIAVSGARVRSAQTRGAVVKPF